MTRRAISFAALIFGVATVGALRLSAQQNDGPAARVNGEAILQSEIKAILDQRPPSPTPLPANVERSVRLEVLDMLVDDMLMRQFLRQNAPAAQQPEVQKEVAELKDALKKQNLAYEKWLVDNKMTEQRMMQDVAAHIQWKHYLATRISDAEVKNYYFANKPFFDKIYVKASHILLKTSSNYTAGEHETLKQKLAQVRQEITSGRTTFEQAARTYSECPSKDKGGDIGMFPYKFVVVEPFARAAFTTKVGDITDVVRTDFGYHLIKVVDRTPGETSKLDDMKDTVRKVIAQDMELYPKILAEQRRIAKIENLLQ
ncbi:MAG: peptidylprolyl isomerase [Gemmataceae bacterium]|nr:peptidylprolyl isomerase [Gemmataceae bacterium]